MAHTYVINADTLYYLTLAASMSLVAMPALGLELVIAHVAKSWRGVGAFAWCFILGAMAFVLSLQELHIMSFIRHLTHG